MKKLVISILVVFLSFSLLFSDEITATEIMRKVYDREKGEDQQADLKMVLTAKNGDKRVREIRQFSKDYGDSEKKIMFFKSPADVKNTSFMNWSYSKKGKNDDQWIYLPVLKNVKRISSDSRSDYFMGSDFTYDDLGERKPDSDTHKLQREEIYGGEKCYVVESIPKDGEYIYSRTVSWIVKDKWIGLKKEFYDEDGNLLKILNVKEFKKVKNYLMITHSEMDNVSKKHKTEMILSNIKVDEGISDRKFTDRMMKRGIR